MGKLFNDVGNFGDLVNFKFKDVKEKERFEKKLLSLIKETEGIYVNDEVNLMNSSRRIFDELSSKRNQKELLDIAIEMYSLINEDVELNLIYKDSYHETKFTSEVIEEFDINKELTESVNYFLAKCKITSDISILMSKFSDESLSYPVSIDKSKVKVIENKMVGIPKITNYDKLEEEIFVAIEKEMKLFEGKFRVEPTILCDAMFEREDEFPMLNFPESSFIINEKEYGDRLLIRLEKNLQSITYWSLKNSNFDEVINHLQNYIERIIKPLNLKTKFS